MRYKYFYFAAAIAALALLPVISNSISSAPPEMRIVPVQLEVEKPAAPDPKLLTHAQEIWISALEWCESRGKPSAVNPNDSDGTPSYYSYQFKPGTFRSLGIAYGVIDKGQAEKDLLSLMQKTELQRQIVRDMIKDKSINIAKQFPGCVAQIGLPPVY